MKIHSTLIHGAIDEVLQLMDEMEHQTFAEELLIMAFRNLCGVMKEIAK